VNTIMQARFKEPYPARSTVQVAALPKGAVFEVEGILAL
jgi:2-iminobutanoate/2-iminopropanoate deaminase